MSSSPGDFWFYIALCGFLITSALWVYLFRRYRLNKSKNTLFPDSQPPVHLEPVKVVASQPAPMQERLTPVETTNHESKAGIAGPSPAVIYLQNLKAHIENFEKEVHELRSQVATSIQKHDSQFEALLQRLGELQKAIHQQQAAPPEQRTPTPKRADNETMERVPSLRTSSPPTAATPANLAGTEQVIRLELEQPAKNSDKVSPADSTPAATQDTEVDLFKPKKKGPVWPV